MGFVDSLTHTTAIEIVQGICSFISSILLVADTVLDALQCKTYYDFANEELPNEKVKISKLYFICSMAIWAGPPVCLAIFWLISYYFDPSYGRSWYDLEITLCSQRFDHSQKVCMKS